MDAFLRIVLGKEQQLGFRDLVANPQDHLGRLPVEARLVASFVQLSDTHVCDSQSGLRLSWADHYADPHNPYSKHVGEPLGAYRAQEMLTTQVLASMIETCNQLTSPLTQAKPTAIVITGDITDNAQCNELAWARSVIAGEALAPNSGRLKYDGPGGHDQNPNFWHPEHAQDNPGLRYGFPKIPGLLEAATSAFKPEGAAIDVHLVHGNHDLLALGTFPLDSELGQIANTEVAMGEFVSDAAALAAAKSVSPIGPVEFPKLSDLKTFEITPDRGRTWVSAGFSGSSQRYYSTAIGEVVLIAIDTVNPHGGYDGSLDQKQFAWLREQLHEHANEVVLIAAHHPLDKLQNTYSPGEKRIGGEELASLLHEYPQVIAYFAGHDHENRVVQIGTFWHIETGSLIDWPQEGRLVEVFRSNDEVFIGLSMFSHLSTINPIVDSEPDLDLSDYRELAGLSRQLAGNDWQRRAGKGHVDLMAGGSQDRNIILQVPFPH